MDKITPLNSSPDRMRYENYLESPVTVSASTVHTVYLASALEVMMLVELVTV